MLTKKFWLDAVERSIKTMAQVLLTLAALDPMSHDFQTALQTKLVGAVMAGVVSILTSIASTGFGQRDSASVIDTAGDDGQTLVTVAIVAAATTVIVIALLKVFNLL